MVFFRSSYEYWVTPVETWFVTLDSDTVLDQELYSPKEEPKKDKIQSPGGYACLGVVVVIAVHDTVAGNYFEAMAGWMLAGVLVWAMVTLP
jgi:hypothetical protein